MLDQARQAGRIRLELYPMAFIDEGSAAAANAFACAAEAGFGPATTPACSPTRPCAGATTSCSVWPGRSGRPRRRQFTRCVTGRTHAGWVDSINAAAAQHGVTGTPTLFVDGDGST